MQKLWLILLTVVIVGIKTFDFTLTLATAAVCIILSWLLSIAQDETILFERVNKLELELATLKKRLQILEKANGLESPEEFEHLPEGISDSSPNEYINVSHLPNVSANDLPINQPSYSSITPLSNEQTVSNIPNHLIPQITEFAVEQPEEQAIQQHFQEIPENKEIEKNTEPNPILAWFLRGNPLLKVGMVVLFLGLAFLLRYIGNHIGIEVKYLSVFATGVIATIMGWKLQNHKREYGLALQGFGFAVIYLTSLSAFKWHELLPAKLVFVSMVGAMMLMAILAIKQNAKIMAQVAVIGGLVAPILASDGSNNHLVLFTYLALLNTGIAVMAWFKTWRSLNIIGFIGTFSIASAWGNHGYTVQHFATTEPFLLYHWLLYTLIACFFARNTLQHEPLSGNLSSIPDNASLERIWQTISAYGTHISGLDSTLLFGTALTAFGFQYKMVADWHHMATWSALGFAIVYAGFAYYFAKQNQLFAVMKQAFAILSLLFITLAIALALEGQWTATAWALEAALVYVFGIIQRQPQTRLIAIGIYILSAITQFTSLHWGKDTLLSGSFIGTLLATLSGVSMFYFWYTKRREDCADWEHHTQQIILILSLIHALTLPMMLWSHLGNMLAMSAYALVFAGCQFTRKNTVLSIFTLVSVLLAVWFDLIQNYYLLDTAMACVWIMAAWLLQCARWQNQKDYFNFVIGWLTLALGVGTALIHIQQDLDVWVISHDMYHYHSELAEFLLLFIPLAFISQWIRWREGIQTAFAGTILFMLLTLVKLSDWAETIMFLGSLKITLATGLIIYLLRQFKNIIWHGTGVSVLCVVWTAWLGFLGQVYFSETVWAQLMWVIVPMTVWLTIFAQRKSPFIQKYQEIYWYFASPILAAYTLIWLLYANWVIPQPSGLPYLPLLNPLELTTGVIIWQFARWLPTWLPENIDAGIRKWSQILPFALAWFAVSAMVMRVWHFYGDVKWALADLLASFSLQASLSIVWALMAIILMVLGNQRHSRNAWLIGASLMGVVVMKLFLVELGNSSGLARIVSFIVVGLLLLLVGWFAPVPPKQIDNHDDK